MPSAPDCGETRLRADAASNRARILDAARTVFGRDGVSAPLTTVAREAGVGIATLYRRFPERDALVAEAFGEAIARYRAVAADAAAVDDPWESFVALVCGVGEIEADNRGFTHVIQSATPPLRPTDSEHAEGYARVVHVVERGQGAGVLRPDLSPEDLPVISFAIAGILEATRDDAPDAWRRHVALVLDGCRASATSPLPPPVPPRVMQRAMIRSARRRQTR
jgi:AcrR family transcriptional regulator